MAYAVRAQVPSDFSASPDVTLESGAPASPITGKEAGHVSVLRLCASQHTGRAFARRGKMALFKTGLGVHLHQSFKFIQRYHIFLIKEEQGSSCWD